MVITFTIHWWEIVVASPWLMLVGFTMYAGCLNAWHPDLPNWVKAFLLPPLLVFGAFDVAFNIVIGTPLFLFEPPFIHGNTFSQRCCYWFNQKDAGWKNEVANFFAWLLNKFNPNHIS